jgi:hypothetical protein
MWLYIGIYLIIGLAIAAYYYARKIDEQKDNYGEVMMMSLLGIIMWPIAIVMAAIELPKALADRTQKRNDKNE